MKLTGRVKGKLATLNIILVAHRLISSAVKNTAAPKNDIKI